MGGNNTDIVSDCISSLNVLSLASNGLSSALENITLVAKRIEQRVNELETREMQLGRLSDILANKRQELEMVETKIRERENNVKERENRMIEAEELRAEIEKKMALNAERWDNKIQMNVGGQEFATSKTTLLECKGSYFEAMLTSDHTQVVTDSKFFIDRDPKYFPAVLNFLREGKLRNSDIKSADLEELEEEFAYYRIPFPIKIPEEMSSTPTLGSQPTAQSTTSQSTTSQSTTSQTTKTKTETQPKMNSEHLNKPIGKFEGGNLLSPAMRDVVKCWIPNNKFSLIYKASRDGFKAKHFHKMCDGKGPTLVVIQSNDNYFFGGFSPISWDSSSNYIYHSDSFIFSLSNPHSISPSRYYLKRGNNQSIRCQQHNCAVFGDGDIRIESCANTSPSYIYFPASYYDTTDKRKLTFTGSQSFISKDIEVYSVAPFEK